MHPRYNSVMVAEELGVPVLKVQHHYAHILSCMVENDCADQVIGVSFDGTGYGTDGTIWGGEILLSDRNGFERLGSVMPFLQPGGDAFLQRRLEDRGIADLLLMGDREKAAEIIEKLELLYEAGSECTVYHGRPQDQYSDIHQCRKTFDGVSAILGIRRKSTFEGEASMALEFAVKNTEQKNC